MVAIIIPAYKEEKSIEGTIKAALKQDAEEIILIDDRSTDKTKEIASQYPITILDKQGKQGKAQSIYEAAQHTTQEHIIIIDADTQIIDITDIKQKLEDGADLVGGIIQIEKDGTLKTEIEAQEYKTSIETMKPLLYDKLGYLVSVSGALLGIKREHILAHPIPEGLHGEDIYWTQIGQQLGWKIELSTSTATTKPIPSIRALITQRGRWARGWAATIKATGRLTPLMEIIPLSYRLIATILAAIASDYTTGTYWIGILLALIAYLTWEYSQSRSLKTAIGCMLWRQITLAGYISALTSGKKWSVLR